MFQCSNPPRTTDNLLKRIISANCCIRTVVYPDDGPRYARNMYMVIKYTRNKLCIKLVYLYTVQSFYPETCSRTPCCICVSGIRTWACLQQIKSSRSYFVPSNITDNTWKKSRVPIEQGTADNTTIRILFVFRNGQANLLSRTNQRENFVTVLLYENMCESSANKQRDRWAEFYSWNFCLCPCYR